MKDTRSSILFQKAKEEEYVFNFLKTTVDDLLGDAMFLATLTWVFDLWNVIQASLMNRGSRVSGDND